MNQDNELPPQEVTAPAKLQPDWSNAPNLSQLKQDFDDGKQVAEAQISKIKQWLDYMHATGEGKARAPKGRSQVQPKLIRKQAEWRYASLSEPFLSSPNVFNVEPVTWEDVEAARQNQMVLNYQFNNKLNKQKFIDTFIRAAVNEGTAIVKTGWDFRTREVEEVKITYALYEDQSAMQTMEEIAQLKAESPSEYPELPEELRVAFENYESDGIPYIAIPNGSEKVKVQKTVVNQPTLKVCDFRNIVIDPSCNGDMNKAKFVVETFESSYAELKADGRYKNLEKINEQTSDILSQPDYATGSESVRNFDFADRSRKRLVVHEYWGYYDIHGDGELHSIVATWVGQILIRLELNPFPDGKIPYVVAAYLPVKDSVYGDSDGSLLIDNQKIVGAISRGMIDIMAQSANGQVGFQKGALDITNRRRFERGETYEFNPGNNPATAIYTHTFQEIPRSAEYMLNQQQLEAESMTGVKAFNTGISGQALGDTATGIRGALDAASKRELGILRRLSDCLIEVGRRVIAMNAEFLDDEEVIRITNEGFVTVRRDDLAGEFDLRLSISTAEEDNAKVADLSFMLQTMGPNLEWGMNQMILAEIAELKKMPDLAHQIRNYQPQPDPIAQRKAELEVALLEAQVQETLAKAQQAASTGYLNTSKAGTEGQKARALGSQADLADLDFVERESGVTQERELEKTRVQADAQAQGRLLDSIVRRNEEATVARTSKR
ncbi:portal protein [Pseudomonas phage KPP21]|uniref:Portal protein n=1 Tax=Pseudomonas phage KPP21 TaxID=1678082 RepID=A0A0H5BI52_BPK21|nr:portal protein [Pseudomonas phage KPP21]UGL60884.1 hypothetical protein [Pseudomonas phage vB_PaeS_TUMS_P6]UNI71966.1 hypothetical protein [Pseudomonas phage vB_PaeP_TUMS_P10]BAR94569.1 hypothetical protein [Pseudomonas phage KPP21]